MTDYRTVFAIDHDNVRLFGPFESIEAGVTYLLNTVEGRALLNISDEEWPLYEEAHGPISTDTVEEYEDVLGDVFQISFRQAQAPGESDV